MNPGDKLKYKRHLILEQIGETGQEKLFKAKVLVVGAGGLGSPILLYLTAAGVGTIGIVDADKVSLSNLQRQVLYKEHQIDGLKVQHAKENLQALNPDCKIITYPTMLNEANAEEICKDYDILVGATDNLESRRVIDNYSRNYKIPFVHGSICEFQGQVTVFNYKGGASYSELFPNKSEIDEPKGVLGVLPGIIGSLQAIEVIKIILGIGEVLSGKLSIYDALKCETTVVKI